MSARAISGRVGPSLPVPRKLRRFELMTLSRLTRLVERPNGFQISYVHESQPVGTARPTGLVDPIDE